MYNLSNLLQFSQLCKLILQGHSGGGYSPEHRAVEHHRVWTAQCCSARSKSSVTLNNQGFSGREAAVSQLKNLNSILMISTLKVSVIQHLDDAGQITKKKQFLDSQLHTPYFLCVCSDLLNRESQTMPSTAKSRSCIKLGT